MKIERIRELKKQRAGFLDSAVLELRAAVVTSRELAGTVEEGCAAYDLVQQDVGKLSILIQMIERIGVYGPDV